MAYDTLIDLYQVPPGGWHYTQPETGLKIEGGDFFNLCQRVRSHRQLNKLSTANLDRQIEVQICQNLKEEARIRFCRDPNPKTIKRVQFADVKHFLMTLANLKRFVSQGEADRRAKICSSCPFNHPIAGCTSCRNLPALVFRVIGRRYTRFDRGLGACGVCGCSLAASVHVPLDSFPAEPNYNFPQWCWHNERADGGRKDHAEGIIGQGSLENKKRGQ